MSDKIKKIDYIKKIMQIAMKIKNYFFNRFFLLIFFTLLVISLHWCFIGEIPPEPHEANLWFYSGIFMVLFSILFIEPYYTSPKNVITNIIPLLLVFLAIKSRFDNIFLWWSAIIILGTLLICSIIAITLIDKNKSPNHKRNKFAEYLKKSVVFFGRGRVLYSAIFLYFLITYYLENDTYIFILFIIWFLILAINPKNITNTFAIKSRKYNENALGEIFGVQSRKLFLVKLFEDRKSILKFDIVEFQYSMQDSEGMTITGIIFDTYLLNQEKWTKVLQLSTSKEENTKLEKNIVYKISAINSEIEKLKINNLVGVIIEDSRIEKIKFEYSKKEDDLQEGDLLELSIGKRRLFYQVIGGVTEKEKLEAKNETGFIEGEAIQLGEWQKEKLSFQKFGWVPSINTPVFKTTASDIPITGLTGSEYKLGTIPNTNLPSVINLDEAVSHHTALIGITGSGKSFLARKIIKEIQKDTKVICIDFTGEWKDLGGQNIEDFQNIKDAMQNEKISLIELEHVNNTTESLEVTNEKLEEIFLYAKENQKNRNVKQICLVLEEAHTIVPETTFLGDLGSYGSNKALVNKMSQIALQGRKYGVGLLVIAQRTANVSKTVLTQCNTVICFQSFDDTTFNFLGNYVGKDMVQTLPNLKQYHAVVAGKAIKANVPIIVDLSTKDGE